MCAIILLSNGIKQVVIQFIINNPQATQKEIAQAVGKSERSIKTIMISLQEKKLIKREGSKKTGTWIAKGRKN
ncbi:MAG: winged helix-turn-helix transcriptional regulator [Fibromonadaceae bacterium]|nr:winged helix-turn-helix transcriptional regulator [Fibromonadaceae bacterium]